jgi:hypothetical protein
MNIYSLYITRSHDELKYFNEVIQFVKKYDNYQIVHLHFKSTSRFSNLTINKKNIDVVIYTNEKTVETSIKSLTDLIKCFHKTGNGIWLYSGHSDGMYLKKRNIKILRVEDFCQIIKAVTGTADLIIFDCCLCGNINCLSSCYQFTDYVIASASYQSMITFLHLKELYKPNTSSITNYGTSLIRSAIRLESKHPTKSFPSAFVMYHLNETFLTFLYLVMYFKHLFGKLTNYVIDKKYYKDLECCFKELGFDISVILKEIIIYKRFIRKSCRNKVIKKDADYSSPSGMMIVTKRPNKNIITESDCFLI